MPGGVERRIGTEPRALCASCSNAGSSLAVRHVEIRLDSRNLRGGEVATSAATLPSATRGGGEGEQRAPGTTDAPTAPEPEISNDGLPAAWGPDHPARLALEGRELPARRSRNRDGAPTMRPEDFGL